MGRKRLTDPERRLGAKTADQLRSLDTDMRVPDSLARWAEENTPEGVMTRRVLRRNLKENAGIKDVKRNVRRNAGLEDVRRNLRRNSGQQ